MFRGTIRQTYVMNGMRFVLVIIYDMFCTMLEKSHSLLLMFFPGKMSFMVIAELVFILNFNLQISNTRYPHQNTYLYVYYMRLRRMCV